MSLSKRKKKSKINYEIKASALSLGLVLIFTGFGFALFRICSYRQAQFEHKLAELDQVNEEIRTLQIHNERMTERVELLKTDAGIEEVAREKLGLVKPGEIAYSVLPPAPPQFTASDDISLVYGKQETKEVNKDRGAVIRILRHLFTPNDNGEVSS